MLGAIGHVAYGANSFFDSCGIGGPRLYILGRAIGVVSFYNEGA